MTGIARLNDIGIGVCPGHPVPVPFTAVIIQGCTMTTSEGMPVSNSNSILMCTCGHTAIPTMFSSNVIAEGGGVHRLGDLGVNNAGGTYVISLAGATVIAGG